MNEFLRDIEFRETLKEYVDLMEKNADVMKKFYEWEAQMKRSYYTYLLEEGFNEPEAMTILIHRSFP